MQKEKAGIEKVQHDIQMLHLFDDLHKNDQISLPVMIALGCISILFFIALYNQNHRKEN